MANKDYKVFIVEGEDREPQIISNISKVFFTHGNYKIITLPAGRNIYMLWAQMKKDDFDTDIVEILKEDNSDIANQLKGLSRNDFSEVYLFFDYDVHHKNLSDSLNDDVVRQMLESFDNETENGKLYISYPMVEALRDYMPGRCGIKKDCFIEKQALIDYKNISAERSLNPHLKKYDIDVWKDIIGVFAMRVFCLLELPDTMEYELYSSEATPNQIYDMEVEKGEDHRVFILSAFPEFLIDYFGVKLWKTCVKYKMQCE